MNIVGKLTGLACISVFLITATACADSEWSNQISVYPDSMVWQYTENISGMDSYNYTFDIDNEKGNQDRFVSAWELLKADKSMRNWFKTTVNTTKNVKIDDSSNGIETHHIDVILSENALGPVRMDNTLTNTYTAEYRFTEGILIHGSTIQLSGLTNSTLIIRLPEDLTVLSTSGIENVTVRQNEIYGTFGWGDDRINNGVEAEITYQMSSEPLINQTVPSENETFLPTMAPTEIPFMGIGALLFILLTAVAILLKY